MQRTTNRTNVLTLAGPELVRSLVERFGFPKIYLEEAGR
jgi:hypothetical protein